MDANYVPSPLPIYPCINRWCQKTTGYEGEICRQCLKNGHIDQEMEARG